MSEKKSPKKRKLKSGFSGRTNIIVIAVCMVAAIALVVGVLYLAGFRYTKYNFKDGYSVTFVGKVDFEGQPKSGRMTFSGKGNAKDGLSASVNTETGVIEYSNGDKYEGETKDLVRHGKGKLTFADGRVYEGEFVADEATGEGNQPIH